MKHGDKITTISPDWVIDSVKNKKLQDVELYKTEYSILPEPPKGLFCMYRSLFSAIQGFHKVRKSGKLRKMTNVRKSRVKRAFLKKVRKFDKTF